MKFRPFGCATVDGLEIPLARTLGGTGSWFIPRFAMAFQNGGIKVETTGAFFLVYPRLLEILSRRKE